MEAARNNILRFDGQTVIVTGAGSGLGRSYALHFAARGANVVVNDIARVKTDRGAPDRCADVVVRSIIDAGGSAAASYDSVEGGHKIFETAMDVFGSVDAVINNAGILRDRAFHNMSEDEWEEVQSVHVKGAFRLTRACWPHMREKEYGRVVFTSSGTALLGNFGQANYAAAKAAVVGFAKSLALEGAKSNINVNAICPSASTQWMLDNWGKEFEGPLCPDKVAPVILFLCHDSCCVTGALVEAGGGAFSLMRWERSGGIGFSIDRAPTPEEIGHNWSKIADFTGSDHPASTDELLKKILNHAGFRELKK